jgi:hypothetical protein
MSVKKTYRDAIYEAESVLQNVRSRFLRKTGWLSTCRVPGAINLWEKEIDGKIIIVNTQTAIAMQDCLV